ncbi:hypothetical protein [Paenibacillus sp. PAMC21692]|uniref:hypothetical protein n=1 Tax=Paenibacillus sp. PAMC21692 TaxID=2762320 RepID=UPI00164DB37C|nr:hypothetical protein [Paenibacillus sp. PAMC21692]QNK58551.1 hypothetical protein H7F31_06495 [Paenibacillus sp. PAMC21692]
MLDFIDSYLTGDAWERLCESCFRMKYEDEHFTPIPAVHGGDGGIEGFTRTGRVYQCYCPEREYSDDELHNHLRNKMTKDINKLVSLKYGKRLKELGVLRIKEWHFVIPQYKDSRIIVHAETKRKEVLAYKRENPEEYDYIDESFAIVIKQAEDFKVEITRIIRSTITDVKLNFAIFNAGKPDWSKCDSEKADNIKRKVKAVMGEVDESDEDFNDVVNMYIESYINGIEILRILRVSYSEVYEDLYMLEQSYKKQVKIKTKMNTDSSMNSKLFNDILDDFQNKLEQQFKYLTPASIMDLKNDLVSGWLADCSMQFKSR